MKAPNMKGWIMALCLTACGLQGFADSDEVENPLKAGYHEIKSDEAYQIIKEHKEMIVLDIRTEKEYVEGHIDKAKWVDYYADEFKAQLEKLDRKAPYLVHCASGGRSGKSMQIFKDLGFTRIYHMNDGFRGWSRHQYPAKTGKPEPGSDK